MKWKRAIVAASLVLPLLLVLGLGFGTDPHAVPSALVGQPAPDCRLTTLDGQPVSLGTPDGRPTVINFWSTWCIPCAAEHALLQQVAEAAGEQLRFVGVIYQDSADNVRPWLTRRGQEYPQYLDPASRCALEYGVTGVPETFFVDPDGTVRYREAGAVSPQTLMQQVRALLAPPTETHS